MASLLQGQRALVTGASRGIGRAVAERLREDGATILTVARSGAADRDAVAADFTAAAGCVAVAEAVPTRPGGIV